jgi:hypothetical protein
VSAEIKSQNHSPAHGSKQHHITHVTADAMLQTRMQIAKHTRTVNPALKTTCTSVETTTVWSMQEPLKQRYCTSKYHLSLETTTTLSHEWPFSMQISLHQVIHVYVCVHLCHSNARCVREHHQE